MEALTRFIYLSSNPRGLEDFLGHPQIGNCCESEYRKDQNWDAADAARQMYCAYSEIGISSRLRALAKLCRRVTPNVFLRLGVSAGWAFHETIRLSTTDEQDLKHTILFELFFPSRTVCGGDRKLSFFLGTCIYTYIYMYVYALGLSLPPPHGQGEAES